MKVSNSYEWHQKKLYKDIGKIEDISDIIRGLKIINNYNVKEATKGAYCSALKSLFWEKNEFNKRNFSDIEWEYQKIKYPASGNYSKQNLTLDDINIIIDGCRTEKQKLFITFLSKTGIRISEMCGILLKECIVKGKNVEIKIIAKKTNATIYKEIDFALFDRIKRHFNGNEYLFETGNGKSYNRCYVSNQIHKIAGHAYTKRYVSTEIKNGSEISGYDISAHSLRHYYITNRIEKHDNLTEISRSVGHINRGGILDRYYTGD